MPSAAALGSGAVTTPLGHGCGCDSAGSALAVSARAMESRSPLPILMSFATLLGILVTVSACGGATAASLAPTAIPLPIGRNLLPPARLELSGNGTWMACFGVGVGGYTECAFRGAVHNAGAGCATRIRGVTHFFDSNRQEMTGAAWALDSSTIARPDDTVMYLTERVPMAIINATAGYDITDLQWTDTACP